MAAVKCFCCKEVESLFYNFAFEIIILGRVLCILFCLWFWFVFNEKNLGVIFQTSNLS